MQVPNIKINLRSFIIALISIFILLAISPFISLLLPEKLTDHMYRQLTDRVIAERETAGLKSDEEIILKLLSYTHNHIFLPKEAFPYSGKPLDYLVNGKGWCDYEAKVLNVLLSKKNIKTRYAMLMDKTGISRHTVSEVYFHNRWAVFDPLENTYFKLADGEYATLDDLSRDPQIILNHNKLRELEKTNKDEYETQKAWYESMFPMPMPPRRSGIFTNRVNIFDRVFDLYTYLFGKSFTYSYQDAYLKRKLASFKKEDYRLFFAAKNYKFYGRRDLAINAYKKLTSDFPDSEYFDDSLFFLALLYIDIDKNYAAAISTLNNLLTKYPNNEWSNIAADLVGKYKD